LKNLIRLAKEREYMKKIGLLEKDEYIGEPQY